MECTRSKSKIAGLTFLVLLTIAVGYFLTTLPSLKARAWGWVLMGFFCVCLLLLISNLFKKGPALVINEKGIEDFQSKRGLIPWSDIACVRIKPVQGTRYLAIEAKGQIIEIGFSSLTPGLDEVWDYLKISFPEKTKS
jgi:hypothetical protein